MPNYVENAFIRVSQPAIYRALVLNEKNEIDFSKLLPIPDTLNISSGSNSLTTSRVPYGSVDSLILYKAKKIIGKRPQIDISGYLSEIVPLFYDSKDISKEELFCKIIGAYNFVKYKSVDWYEYALKTWGCKWNASDTYEGTDMLHIFSTAWACPIQWLTELGKHIDFTLYFADEDMGSNCGYVISKNGKIKIETFDRVPEKAICWAYYVRSSQESLEEDIEEFEEGEGSTMREASKDWDVNINAILNQISIQEA